MKNIRNQKARLCPGRLACFILKCGLPAVLAVLLWIVYCLFRVPFVSDPALIAECCEMMEIAFASLCIVVGGALFGDVLEKRASGKQ